jgi:hypothetical protein
MSSVFFFLGIQSFFPLDSNNNALGYKYTTSNTVFYVKFTTKSDSPSKTIFILIVYLIEL